MEAPGQSQGLDKLQGDFERLNNLIGKEQTVLSSAAKKVGQLAAKLTLGAVKGPGLQRELDEKIVVLEKKFLNLENPSSNDIVQLIKLGNQAVKCQGALAKRKGTSDNNKNHFNFELLAPKIKNQTPEVMDQVLRDMHLETDEAKQLFMGVFEARNKVPNKETQVKDPVILDKAIFIMKENPELKTNEFLRNEYFALIVQRHGIENYSNEEVYGLVALFFDRQEISGTGTFNNAHDILHPLMERLNIKVDLSLNGLNATNKEMTAVQNKEVGSNKDLEMTAADQTIDMSITGAGVVQGFRIETVAGNDQAFSGRHTSDDVVSFAHFEDGTVQMCVTDGEGGSVNSDIYSALVNKWLHIKFQEKKGGITKATDATDVMKDVLQAAKQAADKEFHLHFFRGAKDDVQNKIKGGTTVAFTAVIKIGDQNDQNYAVGVNVFDSPVVILRGEENAYVFVGEGDNTNLKSSEDPNSDDQKRTNFFAVPINHNDQIVLCSDGITDNIQGKTEAVNKGQPLLQGYQTKDNAHLHDLMQRKARELADQVPQTNIAAIRDHTKNLRSFLYHIIPANNLLSVFNKKAFNQMALILDNHAINLLTEKGEKATLEDFIEALKNPTQKSKLLDDFFSELAKKLGLEIKENFLESEERNYTDLANDFIKQLTDKAAEFVNLSFEETDSIDDRLKKLITAQKDNFSDTKVDGTSYLAYTFNQEQK